MQKTKRESAKTASKQARSAPGGPATGKGRPTNGSRSRGGVNDTGDTPPLDNIPAFIEPIPQVPAVDYATPSSDEVQEDPGANMPIASYYPRFGGSLPANMNNVRLPAMRDVGKDTDGKVIPHKRSEKVAKAVAELALAGTPENTICAILNIRPGHLKQYYSNELSHTRTIVDARLASSAYALALAGDGPMLKYMTKARLNWRDGDIAGDGAAFFQNIHIHADGGDDGRNS